MRAVTAALLAALVLHLPTARAAGDAKAGADVFATECAECHSLKEGKHKKGPSMFATLGRKAGQQADFDYSVALKASAIVWTPEQVDAYITAPKLAVPGGKMKYDGLASARARADLLAYLATVK